MTLEFSLTQEQEAIRDLAHEFAVNEIRPVAAHHDETEEFPYEVVKKAHKLGLTPAAFLPEEYGGQNLDFLTELDSGSDALSMKTRATRVSDGYVLNGTKQFCTNGGIADYHVIYANTDPSKGPAGIASFLVPKGTPGLKMGRKEQKLGVRASHTAQVILEDCHIPLDHRLGGEPDAENAGLGALGALMTLEATRPAVAAGALGIARAHMACRLDGDPGSSVRASGGIDGEMLCGRRGHGGHHRCDPGPRRLWVHQGIPRREVVPRREDLSDLGGDRGDSEACHLARSCRPASHHQIEGIEHVRSHGKGCCRHGRLARPGSPGRAHTRTAGR